MPSMVSSPRRLQSGHFTCYLNRTYHELTTRNFFFLTTITRLVHSASADVEAVPYTATQTQQLNRECELELRGATGASIVTSNTFGLHGPTHKYEGLAGRFPAFLPCS